MNPDFLIIPKIVQNCPGLRPTDWIIYGVIYWFEHLKDGKCTASNHTIGKVAGSTGSISDRAVCGGLDRLEKNHFIQRIYEGNTKKVRLEIRAMASFNMPFISPEPQKEKKPKSPLPTVIKETPEEFAIRFFSGDKEAIGPIGKQLEGAGIPQNVVVNEMIKFKNYWTELSKNGKKQRWEMEKVFEVKRRLGTWFRNIAERQRQKRAGSGVEI